MNNYFMGQDGFNWFVGVVEDRADPEKAGRVRVRCLGYHSAKTEDIPMEDLPWASVMMPVTAGANSGIGVSPHFLIEGTWVVGFFRDPAKQEPVIIGAIPGKNTDVKTNFTVASSSAVGGYSKGGGFKDPNAKYPTSAYVGKTDTNFLAQELQTTHIATGTRTTNDPASWSTASGEATFLTSGIEGSKYPFNHVLETESGHFVEFDDTEGNERIHIYHKLGTFLEIDKSGNVMIKTVGNVTNVVAGNMDTYVQGNYSLSVDGNLDMYAVGNLTEKVNGNRKTTITGNDEVAITGTLTAKVTADVTNTYSANLTTTITALGSIKASGAMVVGGSSISFN